MPEPQMDIGADSVYTRGGITLYNGKCADILPWLGEVGLIVTDPPYGQEYVSKRRAESLPGMAGDGSGERDDVAEALRIAVRKLARGRHAYIFGPSDVLPDEMCGRAELVWDKRIVGTGNLASPWAKSHEPITFGVYEPSKANRAKGYGNGVARLRAGSVLSYQRPTGAAVRHPSEKPVPLLRRLIESSSRIGEVVLDPFAGSGSTLVAAALEGRRAIGIEVNREYAELAVQRVDAVLNALERIPEAATPEGGEDA